MFPSASEIDHEFSYIHPAAGVNITSVQADRSTHIS